MARVIVARRPGRREGDGQIRRSRLDTAGSVAGDRGAGDRVPRALLLPPKKQAARHSCRAAFDALHETAKQSEGRTSLAPVVSFGDTADTGSRTARTRRSTAERLLSWGLPPFQRSSRRAVAQSLVPRSPFVVGLRPDLGVFPTAGGCDRSKTVAPPLLGLVPLQSMTGSAVGALSGSDASRGVSRPYSASGHGSPLTRDLPRPGSGAATGFRTLLPRSFSRVPPTG